MRLRRAGKATGGRKDNADKAPTRGKLRGYWNNGVIGNSMMTARHQREAMRLLYKWLNRRSQRRSIPWRQFTDRQPGWKLPPPRVVETRSASALQAAAQSV